MYDVMQSTCVSISKHRRTENFERHEIFATGMKFWLDLYYENIICV